MSKARTVIAFDWGRKWIGCAVGQSITRTANPLPALKARDGQPDWQQIAALIDEWQPQRLVVGLPLNMDGSDSSSSASATKFARRLEGRFGIAVEMQDERLSSFEARGALLAEQRDGEFRRRGVDSRSAVIILESWFRENPPTSDGAA